MNKTEKNISPRFFYQSKYSSRVWNMIQNKDLVICGIGLCRGMRIYCRFFCGDGAEQWKKDPCWAQLGSITHLTLQCSAWLLVTALSTQQSSGLLPWAPMSALQITAAFPLAEKQKASTQKAQRHLHSLCFERNVPCFSVLWRTHWKICVYPGMGLLLVWLPRSLALLILLKSHHRSQHILSHIWQDVRPLNRSSNWDILALWCEALKPGRGWDSVEPSQVQKLSFLEGSLWHS